jgi:hypothetical protein
MLKKLLPLPAKKDDESLLVMVCGPPGFMKLLSGEKTKDFKQVFTHSSLFNSLHEDSDRPIDQANTNILLF